MLAYITARNIMWSAIVVAFLQVIILTFTTPQDADEAAHIGTGLELLDSDSYKYERMHPPLARVIAALPAYLLLDKSQPAATCQEDFDQWYDHMKATHQGDAFGHYCLMQMPHTFMDDHARYMGRMMMWGLYALTIWAVYLLARELTFAKEAACFSAALIGCIPIIMWLGRTVMTDLALVCFATFTLYGMARLIRTPNLPNAALLGFFAGLAALSKFTAPYFLPFVAGLWLFVQPQKRLTVLGYCMPALLVASFVLAIGWGFNVEAFREGLITAELKAHHGHSGDLFYKGENHLGTWYFYPALFLIRTPICILLLAGVGAYWLYQTNRRLCIQLAGAVFLILALSVPTKVNINIHHLALIYVPVCLLAGYSCYRLFAKESGKVAVAAVFVVLLSTGSTPNHLGYENTIAHYYYRLTVLGAQ